MIRGTVANHEGTVQLNVFGRADRCESIEAVVDTGYDGWLSLPQSLIIHRPSNRRTFEA